MEIMMSGGHFNYDQHRIGEIHDEIDSIVKHNNDIDEWGCSHGYSKKTLRVFKKANRILKLAEIYAQRIDWLVSGDDGEEAFHKRLKEDIDSLDINLNTDR